MSYMKPVIPVETIDHGVVISICPECGLAWTEKDRHHPEYDPTPQHQWEVTEGWTPDDQSWRKADEHNPEGL